MTFTVSGEWDRRFRPYAPTHVHVAREPPVTTGGRRARRRAAPTTTTTTDDTATDDSAADDDRHRRTPTTIVGALSVTAITPVCVNDAPFVRVTFGNQPEFNGRPATVTFIDINGVTVATHSATYTANGTLTFVYPGASVDAAGNPTDWPGWVFDGDEWVPDPTDNYLRSGLTVRVDVNPTATGQVSYPPATSTCADPETGGPPTGVAGRAAGNRARHAAGSHGLPDWRWRSAWVPSPSAAAGRPDRQAVAASIAARSVSTSNSISALLIVSGQPIITASCDRAGAGRVDPHVAGEALADHRHRQRTAARCQLDAAEQPAAAQRRPRRGDRRAHRRAASRARRPSSRARSTRCSASITSSTAAAPAQAPSLAVNVKYMNREPRSGSTTASVAATMPIGT